MEYYKVNIGRLPLQVVWSWGNIMVFLTFVILYRVLRVTRYGPVLAPAEPGIRELVEDEIPAAAKATLEATSAELIELGLQPVMYFAVGTIGPMSGLARLFLATDGRCSAVASSSRSGLVSERSVALMSVDDSGTVIGTSSARSTLPVVPGDDVLVAVPVPKWWRQIGHMWTRQAWEAGAPDWGRPLVLTAAQRTRVPAALIAAVIHVESRWRPNAVSPSGAIGLMQLMPRTARELRVDPWDPDANIDGGAHYLRRLLDALDDVGLALAAYNSGPKRVMAERKIPDIQETRLYVMKVLASLRLGLSANAERIE